jgi:DNA-binding CsgD family transcriptional regulator/tetratricopeptide (TPR) repeat protein
MEKTFVRGADRYWGELAHHAYEAGMWRQAQDYSERAGNQAHALYAAGEAAVHFTHAVEATRKMEEAPTAILLRARGKAYEMLSDFDAARADFEASLHAAQQSGDGVAEWQASLDLGFLWSAHNYGRAGEHFQHALTLARSLNQPTLIAHSLNRVGNWYANVQQPAVALGYHHDALNLFSELSNPRGIAETYDLLGMTYQLNSDLLLSHRAYQQAIVRWRQLQERMGLISSLAALPLCTTSYLKNLDMPAISLQKAVAAAGEARQLAQSIHWRAGEVFASLMLAMCLGSQGNYDHALAVAHMGLRSAEEIEHRQWTVAAQVALGALYLDLLALNDARKHLETALTLAKAVGSQVWIGVTVSYLASTYIVLGSLPQAQALLAEMLTPDTPMQLQGHRLAWFAQAELALAKGDAETAHRIAQELTSSAQNLPPNQAIPKLALLQGEALARLGDFDAATELLRAALLATIEQGTRPLEWRILVALGKCFQAQRKRTEANESFAAVRTLLYNITSEISDVALGHNLLEQAFLMLPTPVTPTPNQIAKQNSGGLTAREREVAQLVAEGKSNQEIASRLVVGIRTVEAHITRILTKLDFSSRVQIAAWVIEQRLNRQNTNDT